MAAVRPSVGIPFTAVPPVGARTSTQRASPLVDARARRVA